MTSHEKALTVTDKHKSEASMVQPANTAEAEEAARSKSVLGEAHRAKDMADERARQRLHTELQQYHVTYEPLMMVSTPQPDERR